MKDMYQIAFCFLISLYIAMSQGIQLIRQEGHKKEITNVSFDHTGELLATASRDHTVKLWDVSSGKLIRTFNGSKRSLNSVTFSNNRKWIASGGNDKIVRIYDLEKGNLIKKIEKTASTIWTLKFSLDDLHLAIGTWDGKVIIISLNNYEQVFSEKLHKNSITDFFFSDDKKFMYSTGSDGIIRKVSLGEYKLIQSFSGYSSSDKRTKFHPSGSQILMSQYSQNAYLYSLYDGKLIKEFSGNYGRNHLVNINENKKFKLFHLIKNKSRDYSLFDDNLYYYSSPNASAATHFVKGLSIYSLDNLRYIYNRPDKIVEKLDPGNLKLKLAFEAMSNWKSEIHNFDNSVLVDSNFSVPFVDYVSHEVKDEYTNNKIFSAKIKVSDDINFVHSIRVEVNGYPVLEKNYGKDKKDVVIDDISFELSNGQNLISFYAINSLGLKSNNYDLDIEYDTRKYQKDDLYLITLASSKYVNHDKDMLNPVNDTKAFAKIIQRKNKRFYNKIHELHLYNNDLSPDKLTRIAALLSDSKINDKVMIYFSGLGKIAKNYKMYLATYNTNFTDFSQNSIDIFNFIETVKESRSRNKLIIFDLCLSEDLSSSEIKRDYSREESYGKISYKVRKNRNSDFAIGINNSKLLFREYMKLISEETGAFVIGNGTDAEFVFKTVKRTNSAFGFALTDGLRNFYADINSNGRITLFELDNYVDEIVNILTKKDNISNYNNRYYPSDFTVLR